MTVLDRVSHVWKSVLYHGVKAVRCERCRRLWFHGIEDECYGVWAPEGMRVTSNALRIGQEGGNRE